MAKNANARPSYHHDEISLVGYYLFIFVVLSRDFFPFVSVAPKARGKSYMTF